MTSFRKKLDKILSESSGKRNLKEDQDNSPTKVHPEKGEDVTHGQIDGTSKIDASGPIKANAVAPTLSTQPGDTTGGPTGHIPTNSDLPRKQLDGLDKDNKSPGTKSYGLHEEGKDDDKDKVDEGKLPPFLKKKDGEGDDKKDEKKEVSEESKEDDDKKVTNEELDNEEGDKVKEAKEDEKDDKEAVNEATAALFNGENLSEAFRLKTSTIFEATLSLRLKDFRNKLTERFTRKLNDRVEEIREQLSESVSGHLDLVVEQWISSNEIPLEKAIKAELVEDFIGGLKSLLEEHYIELPAEKVDIVSEMADRLTGMETKLNEQIGSNLKLRKEIQLFERTNVLSAVSKGLTSTQAEKLRNLAEGIEFKTTKQFELAVTTLKESVDKTPATAAPSTRKTLVEQTLEQGSTTIPESTSSMTNGIREAMARMAKN